MELHGVAWSDVYTIPELTGEFGAYNELEIVYVGDSVWASDTFDSSPCPVTVDDPYYGGTVIGRISVTMTVNGTEANDITVEVTIETFRDNDDDGEPDEGISFYRWEFQNHSDIQDGLCPIHVKKTGFNTNDTSPAEDGICAEAKGCMCVIPEANQNPCQNMCIHSDYSITWADEDWSVCWWIDGKRFEWNVSTEQWEAEDGDTMVATDSDAQGVTVTIGSTTYNNPSDIEPLCAFEVRNSDNETICVIPVSCDDPTNGCCEDFERPAIAEVTIDSFSTTVPGASANIVGASEVNDLALQDAFGNCSYTNSWSDRDALLWYAKLEPFAIDTAVSYECATGAELVYIRVVVSVTESTEDLRGTVAEFEQVFTYVEVEGQDTFEIPFDVATNAFDFSENIGVANDGQVTVKFSQPFTAIP